MAAKNGTSKKSVITIEEFEKDAEAEQEGAVHG
jgi:hypothetical protein